MSIKPVLLSIPILTACIADPDVEVEVTAAEIHGDNWGVASQFQRDRAVKVPGCTATRIAARWALTSAHCLAQEEDDVFFYSSGGYDPEQIGEVDKVVLRPGVDAVACAANSAACWDSTGKFADIALLRLKSHDAELDEDDLDGAQAHLAYDYLGPGQVVFKVGAGDQGTTPNLTGVLLQASDTTASPNDANGMIMTQLDQTDTDDTGGPIYYGHRVLGVRSTTLLGGADRYTSVPVHLSWILATIGYEWRGQPVQASTKYNGAVLESLTTGSETKCGYVCEERTSCEAYRYDHATSTCDILDEVTSASTNSTWTAALRNGPRANAGDSVVGYVRSDGLDSVLHVTAGNEIHELFRQNGEWSWGDPQGTAPAVAAGGKLTASRRADGTNTVVYRSTAAHVIELSLDDGTWDAYDLTALVGGENAAGPPAAIVKADGVSAIYYRGATTGHIIELRLGSRGWITRDLMTVVGSSATAASDPSVFVRSDGYTSVVFRSGASGDAIKELAQSETGTWSIGTPSSLAGSLPAVGRPFGFTHSNGTNAIVYRATGGQIIQLSLVGGVWSATQLATGAAGDPVAYTRTDLVEAVVFRNTSSRIIEAANGTTFDLTTAASAPSSATAPSIYHRVDGNNAVVYETITGFVHELTLKRGQSWKTANLSSVAGESL